MDIIASVKGSKISTDRIVADYGLILSAPSMFRRPGQSIDGGCSGDSDDEVS